MIRWTQRKMREFQSTLPARGATTTGTTSRAYMRISIHAPRTGSDGVTMHEASLMLAFQSTLPARGATGHALANPQRGSISIHAPRTGSDTSAWVTGAAWVRDFNPRSPHGERPDDKKVLQKHLDFNPRSPHGERRQATWAAGLRRRISIHAPRTGSDCAK